MGSWFGVFYFFGFGFQLKSYMLVILYGCSFASFLCVFFGKEGDLCSMLLCHEALYSARAFSA